MIVGIHHVAISVPDMAKARAFYLDALGFEEVWGKPWENNPISDQVIGLNNSAGDVAMIRAGNAYLELWEYAEPKPVTQNPEYSPADHGFAHICLQVTDIQYEFDRLQQAGMTFHQAPVPLPGDRAAIYGRDPFGNIIELYEITGPDAIPST